MAPKIAPSFCWVKLSKTLRFPTPKDDLLSYTLANQNLVQSDWNLGGVFGITFKILGDRIWRGNKNKVTQLPGYSHPKCKDPKLSPKLIELSQVINQVMPNRHFRRQKKHCLKAERWTFHPSKECGIAIGFPHETNQLGSFVLAKRWRFWRILKVDQQKNTAKIEAQTQKKHKQIHVAGWCKNFSRSFLWAMLRQWSIQPTTDDTRAFERRFDLISPRNSTSWWDLNRYDPQGHKNRVQPTWWECQEFAISAYFAGLLTLLQQNNGYGKNMEN